MIFRPDEAIEMELRHIWQGEERIARQEDLVRHLEELGCSEALTRARDLLIDCRSSVEVAKERLADLRRRYPDRLPE